MNESNPSAPLTFHGGTVGALAPFVLFLAGVAWLGLNGAPDERGFWPVLLAALALGTLLARNRGAYAETVIDGMSQRLVMVMILAWVLAGVLASVMNASGFVDGLVWLAQEVGLSGGGYVVAAFLIAAVVSTATGTSLGTLLLCAPLLYPAGGPLGAEPAILIGALLGGATFGDNISPVSDTTIATAATQRAEIGRVVRSRLRYALPAAGLALLVYGLFGGGSLDGGAESINAEALSVSPAGLPMLIAPALVIVMLLLRRHLLEGLIFGAGASVILALVFGLIPPAEIVSIDPDAFSARGLIIDGVERAVGISIFTLLLMGLVAGLVAGLKTSSLAERLVISEDSQTAENENSAQPSAPTPRRTEWTIVAAISAAVILTTHAVVAILTVGGFARRLGERVGLSPERRANLLDLAVSVWPFLLPYCIPTVLAASLTAAGAETGMPRLGPLTAGLYNAHSWALALVLIIAVTSGWGRNDGETAQTSAPDES